MLIGPLPHHLSIALQLFAIILTLPLIQIASTQPGEMKS